MLVAYGFPRFCEGGVGKGGNRSGPISRHVSGPRVRDCHRGIHGVVGVGSQWLLQRVLEDGKSFDPAEAWRLRLGSRVSAGHGMVRAYMARKCLHPNPPPQTYFQTPAPQLNSCDFAGNHHVIQELNKHLCAR